MNWAEYNSFCRRGIRKEYVHDHTPFPDDMFDAEPPEPTIASDNSTTAHTHDRATGRSMHYPKPR